MVNSMSNLDDDSSQRTHQLEAHLVDPRSSICVDSLLDSIVALIHDCESLQRTKHFDAFYSKFHASAHDIQNKRMHFDDFEQIKILGRGAFGTVDLVRRKNTGQVYAMKTLSKFEMLKRSDSVFFWEERNIMAFSNSDWIVKLYYAFQDAKNLYMIMDYLPGGDLITLIDHYEINESAARFYCAEVVLALDAIHSMGYIHRDVKPDNMLLDSRGHLKLADFGTCIKMDKDGLVRSNTAVGTPDYISPEILKLQNKTGVYGREVDWWAVGVFLYEMIICETPFYAESLVGTYHKIMHHRESLVFPPDVPLSGEARALICALLTDRSTRLGKNGIGDIRIHPFFHNHSEWTWETIQTAAAPIVPPTTGDGNSTDWDKSDTQKRSAEESFSTSKTFVGNQLSFIGFSYSNEQQPLRDRPSSGNANHSELEQRLRVLHDELNSKCQEAQALTGKLHESERLNVALTTENKEIQRKYELELATRQTLEHTLEESQRSLGDEKEARNRTDASHRECTEKIADSERQIHQLTEKLHLERESHLRLKKPYEDLQALANQYERSYNDIHDKYRDLIATKLRLESDSLVVQQSTVEEVASDVLAKTNGTDEERPASDREVQLQNEIKQLQLKNESLSEGLRKMEQMWQMMQTKMEDYEEQIEVGSKLSSLYRTQVNDFNEEIVQLNLRLQQVTDERDRLDEQRSNLFKQLELVNDNLRNDSRHWNTKQERCAELEKEKKNLVSEMDTLRKDSQARLAALNVELNKLQDQYEKAKYDHDQLVRDRDAASNESKQVVDQLQKQVVDLRKRADDERVKKEAAVNKLQEIVINPTQHHPFFARQASGARRQDRDRSERNALRRLEQELEVERLKYRKLQNEKDEELSVLTEDNNKLKRELDARRDDIDRFKRQIELHGSVDNVSLMSDEIEETTRDRLESWVQIPTKNIRKGGWKRQFAVMTKNKMMLYNSEKDQQPAILVDFDKLYHVRAVTQSDVLRVDPGLISKIFQILYDSQSQPLVNSSNSTMSTSMTVSQDNDRPNGETIEYKGHSFIIVTYRMPAECDACNRPCYNLISPPSCLVCTRCCFRCHKQHFDDREDFTQSCRVYDTVSVKELLIMCASESEQKQWIVKLSKKIIRRPASSQHDQSNSSRSSTASFRSPNTSINSFVFGSSNPGQSPKSSTLPVRTK